MGAVVRRTWDVPQELEEILIALGEAMFGDHRRNRINTIAVMAAVAVAAYQCPDDPTAIGKAVHAVMHQQKTLWPRLQYEPPV